MTKDETVLFIHGMFQNAKSWDGWVDLVGSRGFECVARSWPFHEGDPHMLRDSPPEELGELSLQQVIDHYAALIDSLSVRPIIIGHSVGGLVAQKLVARGLAKAAVAICSVAPNRMLAFDRGFFRNSLTIANPLEGNSIYKMTPDGFHQNFANTMERNACDRAYETTATHDSRNVLRDCMFEAGHVDTSIAMAPMLFISAEQDQIIPPQLCRKNADAYREGPATELKMFVRRSHFICGEPGWEQVAHFACDWMESHIQFSRQRIEESQIAGEGLLAM